MKIIILGTAHPYRGGLAAFNERLAQEYIHYGHQVEIYTFTLQYPSFLFPGKTQYTTDAAPDNLKIVRAVNSVNPFNWIKVGRKIKKLKPDLLLIKFWLPFMAPCLGTISGIVKKNHHTVVISILDNIIPHEKRIGDKLFAAYFVKSVQGFIAMSKSVLQDLNLFDTKKPKLFNPHPLYDNFGLLLPKKEALKYLKLQEEFHYVLFFGFIRDYKGLDLLMKAFTDERLKTLNVKLVVAGEFYNNAQTYFELEKSLHLEGQIIWSNDFIPDTEVKYYFSMADIIAQPYKSATQSGVTQIAYHFHKPMLVTKVGGLAEIVPHGKVGYVVSPQPKDIADGLVDFYEHHREEEFKSNINQEKEKYSWKTMLDSINQIYNVIKNDHKK